MTRFLRSNVQISWEIQCLEFTGAFKTPLHLQMPVFGQVNCPSGFLIAISQKVPSSVLAHVTDKALLSSFEICCNLIPLNTWYFLRNLLSKAFRPRFRLSPCKWCFLLSAHLWGPRGKQQETQGPETKGGFGLPGSRTWSHQWVQTDLDSQSLSLTLELEIPRRWMSSGDQRKPAWIWKQHIYVWLRLFLSYV